MKAHLRTRPTMRQKKRYIIFRVISEKEKPDFLNVRGAIWNSLEVWLGDSDMAEANIRFVSNLWNGRTQSGFIQCAPKYVDKVKVALALVRQIGDSKAIVSVIRVSGTIKSGKEKAKV